MNIELDQTAIAATINAKATQAVQAAFGGYEMQKAVAEIVTTEVAQTVVADAIRQAVASIDKTALTQALAAELQRTTTRAVATMLNEGLVDIVCKLRGIGNYGDDVARRAAVKAELLK